MINVLIVEDDPMVAQINKDYIERLPGFKVCDIVGDGQAALDYLQVKKQEIDLIILDIYLPKIDGLALLEKIRGDYQNVDIIFVTAAKERDTIRRGLRLGAIDFLIKPFTFERIATALNKYKQHYELYQGDSLFDQQRLDSLLNNNASNQLPKKMHELTLKKVRQEVEKYQDILDLNQMTTDLNMTNVTLRVYLDYLVEQKVLSKELSSGNIGRPYYIYHKVV
ncbi:MAG: response regulator [Erysipelotrichaceae bacterium]|nr:response regulator [Erysipelotrichaceae bacterium]MDY5252336.1 response regulator [Erysipelotrichaceae bacterium]